MANYTFNKDWTTIHVPLSGWKYYNNGSYEDITDASFKPPMSSVDIHYRLTEHGGGDGFEYYEFKITTSDYTYDKTVHKIQSSLDIVKNDDGTILCSPMQNATLTTTEGDDVVIFAAKQYGLWDVKNTIFGQTGSLSLVWYRTTAASSALPYERLLVTADDLQFNIALTSGNASLINVDFSKYFEGENPKIQMISPLETRSYSKTVMAQISYYDAINSQYVPFVNWKGFSYEQDLEFNEISFPVTLDERADLMDYCRVANTSTVGINVELKTVLTDSYGSMDADIQSISFSLKIVDAPPILNPVVKDSNAVTAALTGDDSVLVRYISNAWVEPHAEATGITTLSEYGFTNGAFTYLNQELVVIEDVEDNVFKFYAINNAGQVTRKTITTGFIPYIKLTTNLNVKASTGEGDMSIEVKGNYFNGSFGATDNELFVYYRYKIDGEEEFSDWVRISNVELDNEKSGYTASVIATGFDYTQKYIFQAYSADAYDTVTTPEKVVVTLPIFDWSANDFNFNVPVSIMGKTIGGANTLLWEGSEVMTAGTTIQLNELISEQMHGIALVFSGLGNVSWNIFFVPKMMVDLYGGGGQTFMMGVNAGLSAFGAKYLYIHDDRIEGHATNDADGDAASGISFSNAQFNLRYVIGV